MIDQAVLDNINSLVNILVGHKTVLVTALWSWNINADPIPTAQWSTSYCAMKITLQYYPTYVIKYNWKFLKQDGRLPPAYFAHSQFYKQSI